MNSAAIELLPDYRAQMFLAKIVAVTDQEDVFGTLGKLKYENICCEKISGEEMKKLLKYYCLVVFCAHTAVVSLQEPFGNYSLLQDGGIDLKSFIFSAIYKVR